ncbi:MAG: cupin domain-containing protein [Myxococcota bacterium]
MKANWLDDSGTLGADIDAASLNEQGVLYQYLNTAETAYRQPLDTLKGDKGYVQEDVIALSPDTPKLDELCAKFLDEHHHEEDEVRFVLGGAGIFDIRSTDDRWMRVVVEAGDLIVVPANRHHRFMLTDDKAIRCVRLFKDKSGWVPHYRNAA